MDLLVSLAFFMLPIALLLGFTLALSLASYLQAKEQARVEALARQSLRKTYDNSKFRRKRL